MPARDIGKMGERHFAGWCSACGLAANHSEEDKTGWDFVIETPGFDCIGGAGSIDEPPFECKIQIKATNSEKLYQDIVLDKLWRLAVDPYPAFLVFIHYCDGPEAAKVFIKHIDEDLIQLVLRRIHKNEQSNNQGISYNKATLRVKYGNISPLEQPYGKTLAGAFSQYVPKGINSYVSKKTDFVKTVGREEGGLALHVAISGQENIERMIEQSVGISTSYAIDNIVVEQIRFGIKKKTPEFQATGGILSIQSNQTFASVLRFREDKFAPAHAFSVSCRVSPFNIIAPSRLHLIRVYNEFIELRLYPGAQRVQATISYDAQSTTVLSKLYDQLSVIVALLEGKSLLASLDLPGGESIEFSFSHNNCSGINVDQIREQMLLVDHTQELVQKLKWHSEAISNIPNLAENAESIFVLRDLLCNNREYRMSCEFSTEKDIETEQEAAALHMFSVKLKNLTIYALAKFMGPCQAAAMGRYRIEGSAVVAKYIVRDRSEDLTGDDIRGIVNEVISLQPELLYVGLNVESG